MTTYETTPGIAPAEVPPAPDHAPQLQSKRRKLARIGAANLARIILGAIVALLLVTTWAANNPAFTSGSTPSDWKSELAAAAVENNVNAGETKGAPQQSVVNGWYANDLAEVHAAQNSYIAGSSMRNGNLLVLIGLGIAGELIIRGVEGARRGRAPYSL